MLIVPKKKFNSKIFLFAFNKYKTILVFILLITILNICNNQKDQKSNESSAELKYEFIPCGKSKCIITQGYCKEKSSPSKDDDKECVCFEEYGTIQNNFNYECNYKKKSQLKAFLLELFLSNGAGHFYLENYYLAIPKLLVWVFSYYFFIVLRITCKSAEDNKKTSLIIASLALFFCLGMLSWQILDVVLFALNKYTDCNGIDMSSWSSSSKDSI